MKFKAGDNFKVIDSGLLGKIVGTTWNSMHQCEEYIVKWSHHKYEETYPVDECDPIWELEPCPVVNSFLTIQNAINSIPIEIKMDGPIKVQCNGFHTWIDVGFHHSKFVCKYCDVKRAD